MARPVEGALAADSLIEAPRRTSATVAALMLSLALVVALGGLARASYDSITRLDELRLNPDLFVPRRGEWSCARSFSGRDGDGLRRSRALPTCSRCARAAGSRGGPDHAGGHDALRCAADQRAK